MNKLLIVFIMGFTLGFSLFIANPSLTAFFVAPPVQVGVAFVEPIFSPGSQDEFIDILRSARSSIELEVYTFSSNALKEELRAAVARGVSVRVMLDNSISSNFEIARELMASAVEVRWTPARFERVHAKFVIIDNETVIVGSNNWTFHSFNLNREASIKIRSTEVAARFLNVFYQDWQEGSAA